MNSRWANWGLLAAATLVLASVTAAEPEEKASDVGGSAVRPPHVILGSQRPPEFPPAALAARLSATVMLSFEVLKDGSVADVKVVSCSHSKVGFEEAAKAAVEKWRFEPGTLNGEPVDFTLSYRLNFGAGEQPRISAGSTETRVAEPSSSESGKGTSPGPSR